MLRKIVFTLWYNRPWRYIPDVVKSMKKYLYTKNKKFFYWVKAHLYLNCVASSPSKEFQKVNEDYGIYMLRGYLEEARKEKIDYKRRIEMGQRLNVEIVSNGKLLANAYYHWDAYTGISLRRTGAILDKLNAIQEPAKDDLDLAIKLLESTGAGINALERNYILADPKLSKYLSINDCVDRNEGVLSITQEGMLNTRNWEEGRVTIDIRKRTILFRVYWEITKEEYLDNLYGDLEHYEQLPTIDYDLEKEIPFDKFEELKNLFTSTADTYGFKKPDGSVIGWIE